MKSSVSLVHKLDRFWDLVSKMQMATVFFICSFSYFLVINDEFLVIKLQILAYLAGSHLSSVEVILNTG